MKKNTFMTLAKRGSLTFFLILPFVVFSQEPTQTQAETESFWDHVQFGGGLGVAIGNDFTDITVAPSAIYNFNEHFALGTGLQYSRLKQKNFYASNVVGASIVGLYNPIEEIQLSLELEEVHVNTTYDDLYDSVKRSFWNTGLYVGAGYRADNVTIGARFNLLFDKDKDLYGDAFMPFIRVYF
ncbi:hypothetical protein [Flavobacterium sp. J49]|uniref:hypothetical protein n=1 Tax=Flavobacterium sp. J49 TaxID=2718534 RepID=UPI001E4176EB|nr:hypothetical protein [Flavobacterium sp. J49]